MCLRDGVEVCKRQLSVFGRSKNFVLCLIERWTRTDVTLVQTEPAKSSHFHNIYKAIRQRVFYNTDDKVVWNDNNNDLPLSFFGFLQVFPDKNAFAVSISALVSYTEHVLFLNKSTLKLGYLINNGYTIIEFLPLSIVEFYGDRDEISHELTSS